jgi:hypothetical protein
VSRLRRGQQERIATGLPSLAARGGTAATGPHDISLHGLGDAYVTVGFGADPARRTELDMVGADFGQLVHLAAIGDWRNFADVAAHELAVNPGGGPIDSNPYGVLAEAGSRVVVDAGGNSLLRIAANGDVSTLAVFPSRPGRPTDSVPTSVTVGPDGAYYVGELTGVPFAVGAARVYRVVPGQAPEVMHAGFTAIIDIDFGPDGSLYVLQHATGPGLSGNGALIRVAPDGTRTTLASEGLLRPTSVRVGDDGAIYVSNRGIFAGTGEVVRITPTTTAAVDANVNDGSAQRSMVPLLLSGSNQEPLSAWEVGSSPTTPETRPASETATPDSSFPEEAAGDEARAPADSMLPHSEQREIGLRDLLFANAWLGEGDPFAAPTW